MIRSKFKNDIFSLLSLNYKKKNLWFEVGFSNRSHIILRILKDLGVITGYVIFKYNKNQLRVRIYLKYINMENILMSPIVFYYKISLRLTIKIKSLLRLRHTLGSTNLIISTNKNLLKIGDCLKFKSGGLLSFIVYVLKWIY